MKSKNACRFLAGTLTAAMVMSTVISAPTEVMAAGNSVVVTNQKELNKALKDKKVKKIVIRTKGLKTFNIKKGDYAGVTLVVDGEKIHFANAGNFKRINIKDAAEFSERGSGNTISVNDTNQLKLKTTKSSADTEIEVNKASEGLEIVANGSVESVTINAGADVTIKGKTEESVSVNVTDKAEGAELTLGTKADVEASANVSVSVGEGAEGTAIETKTEDAKVSVENKTDSSVTVTDSEGKSTTVEAGATSTPSTETDKKEEQKPAAGGGGGSTGGSSSDSGSTGGGSGNPEGTPTWTGTKAVKAPIADVEDEGFVCATTYEASFANGEISFEVEDLKAHTADGGYGKGYWIGFGVEIPDNVSEITYSTDGSNYRDVEESTDVVSFPEYEGKYLPFYLDAGKATTNGRTIYVKFDEAEAVPYTVNTDAVTLDGAPEVVDVPSADKYNSGVAICSTSAKVENNTTIKLSTENGETLKKHVNGADKEGYWIGFGIRVDGNQKVKYAWGTSSGQLTEDTLFGEIIDGQATGNKFFSAYVNVTKDANGKSVLADSSREYIRIQVDEGAVMCYKLDVSGVELEEEPEVAPPSDPEEEVGGGENENPSSTPTEGENENPSSTPTEGENENPSSTPTEEE